MSKHPRTQKEQHEVQVESFFRFNVIIWLLSLTEETTADAGRLSWPHAAVLLLTTCSQDHRHLFVRPTMKKLEVWKQTSSAMSVHGLTYTHNNCQKKWSNLKGR